MSFEPLETKSHWTGSQRIYRFANGYGASVVFDATGQLHSHDHDGKHELAVIKWEGEKKWALTYETPVTSDVEAWLDEDDVQRLLAQIEALPAPSEVQP